MSSPWDYQARLSGEGFGMRKKVAQALTLGE
jgi:hypothetical protein